MKLSYNLFYFDPPLLKPSSFNDLKLIRANTVYKHRCQTFAHAWAVSTTSHRRLSKTQTFINTVKKGVWKLRRYFRMLMKPCMQRLSGVLVISKIVWDSPSNKNNSVISRSFVELRTQTSCRSKMFVSGSVYIYVSVFS